MIAFNIFVKYDDVWMHSAATLRERPHFTLHLAKDNKAIGDLTIDFPSIDAVEEFIMNLENAFGLSEFRNKGEDKDEDS